MGQRGTANYFLTKKQSQKEFCEAKIFTKTVYWIGLLDNNNNKRISINVT